MNKKRAAKPKKKQAKAKPKAKGNKALTDDDLDKVVGGTTVAVEWGDIKGGSTDDKHKDWSE